MRRLFILLSNHLPARETLLAWFPFAGFLISVFRHTERTMFLEIRIKIPLAMDALHNAHRGGRSFCPCRTASSIVP